MSFRRLADNLKHRKQNEVATFLDGCRKPSSKLEYREVITDDRVSSNYKEDDEKKMALTSQNVIEAKHEESSKPIFLSKFANHPTNTIKSVNDFSTLPEKSWLPNRDMELVDKRGGAKRPGLIRAQPIALRKPPKPIRFQESFDARIKDNVQNKVIMISSSSNSSEHYDDRSPVFGGWSSDSLSKKSCARLCLDKLGSSDSDRDYGGEEGAKPFEKVINDSVASIAQSYSEGPADENKRPQWSENDDNPELILFGAPRINEESSSSEILELAKQQPLDEKENSVHIISSPTKDLEGPKDISADEEFLKSGLDICRMSRNNVIVI